MVKLVAKKKCFFYSFCCLVYTICLLYGFHIYGFCFGDKSDGCEVILENVISKLALSHLNATSLAYQQVAPLLEQRRRPDDPPTLFLYLTQTEQCLPDHLKLAIGNPSICQCHVVVLSYQKKCDKDSQVMYIYDPNTTWTTGRNLLFYTFVHNMTNRQEKYLYYIMMDDDIDVRWMEKFRPTFSTKNPWRSYEAFLRKVRPPIAALEINGGNLHRMDSIHQKKDCPIHPEYNPAVYITPTVVAFHYQAVEHVLPYWSKLDNASWWFSSLNSYMWYDFCFHGQVVVHRQLMAFNPKHRPYPRKNFSSDLISLIADHIERRLSEQCKKVMATLLQQHKEKGESYQKYDSPTYCLPPLKPNQTIIPFKECTTDQ